jgi:hypothetical protein
MIIPNSRLVARIGLTTLNESPTLYHAPRKRQGQSFETTLGFQARKIGTDNTTPGKAIKQEIFSVTAPDPAPAVPRQILNRRSGQTTRP